MTKERNKGKSAQRPRYEDAEAEILQILRHLKKRYPHKRGDLHDAIWKELFGEARAIITHTRFAEFDPPGTARRDVPTLGEDIPF